MFAVSHGHQKHLHLPSFEFFLLLNFYRIFFHADSEFEAADVMEHETCVLEKRNTVYLLNTFIIAIGKVALFEL
jgi:hypothetical protein